MTNRTKPPVSSTVPDDEAAKLRCIAARHALPEDALVKFVNDIRDNARSRRRRLSDAQIEELVAGLGGLR